MLFLRLKGDPVKISRLRKITIAAAFVLVIVGLLFNTGTGTLSSFGWQEIAAICPLGVVEVFLASKTIIPRALIVLGLIILFVAVFGKVFCAWLCPVPPLKGLLGKIGKKVPKSDSAKKDQTALTASEVQLLKTKECSSCAKQRAKLDSRHIVLGGSLLSAALFGFPVFCLVCPVGLIFGTIIILWQWIGFNDISLSLLIYPAILIIELLVLRKWCMKFCPLGAMLSLMSLPNKFFRPKVDEQKCRHSRGSSCTNCIDVCPEGLDPHYTNGMHECSKCGLCLEKCPTAAITIPFRHQQTRLSGEKQKG